MQHGLPRLFHQHAPVRRVHAARIQTGAHVFEESTRVGVRLNFVVGRENDLAQTLVVASRRQQVAQRQKFAVRLLIARLEHLFEHLAAQNAALVFVHQAEVGRDAERRRLLAGKRHAQRMHGRDFRAVHEKELTPQTGRTRLLRHRRGDGRRDSLTHFGRRRLGEGHEKQLRDVDGVFGVGHAPQHALGQHGGLARTGRRRNEQRAAPVFYRVFLFTCPLRHCRHLPEAPIRPRRSAL